MRRIILAALLAALAATVALTPARAQETDCVPAVRDEFLREQAIVEWTVYCPAVLPGEFQIERVDGGVNPGGGLFIVTLASSSGAEIIITQGAGASIFARHTRIGPPEESAGDAQFGDLTGKLYAAEPPAVIAFDSDNKGHAVQGSSIGVEAVKQIAAAMKPLAAAALPGTGTGRPTSSGQLLPALLLALTGAVLILAGAGLQPTRRR